MRLLKQTLKPPKPLKKTIVKAIQDYQGALDIFNQSGSAAEGSTETAADNQEEYEEIMAQFIDESQRWYETATATYEKNQEVAIKYKELVALIGRVRWKISRY